MTPPDGSILIASCTMPCYVPAKVYWHADTNHVVIVPDAPQGADETQRRAYDTIVEKMKVHDIGSGFRAPSVRLALQTVSARCGGDHNVCPIVGESA
jgi:hypothetical protein